MDDTDVVITSNVTNVILRRDLIPEIKVMSYVMEILFAPLNSSYNIKKSLDLQLIGLPELYI